MWLKNGFKRHGLILNITDNINAPADVHIVSGPHFAKTKWQGHPRTILLDRAYWHDLKSGQWKSMDYVSLGWMRKDGGRNFQIGVGREPPVISDNRNGRGSIFLADYNGKVERADAVRYHPDNHRSKEPLWQALRRHRIAIGYTTTALVTAGLAGLEIHCRDVRNIMSNPNWLALLPYADWNYEEITNGDAWEHLKNDLNFSDTTSD